MNKSVEKVLSIARGEIGYTPGNARNKYCAEYGVSNCAWCCIFVWWVFFRAGLSKLFFGGNKTAWCPSLMMYHVKAQGLKNDDIMPGDIVFFNFSGKSNAQHVGICEISEKNYVTTIDGNTGTNEANGGNVLRRRRHKKYIVGAYRPSYAVDTSIEYDKLPVLVKGNSKARTAVISLQALLNLWLGVKLECDGYFGPATDSAVREFQKKYSLEVDGSVGPMTWAALIGV